MIQDTAHCLFSLPLRHRQGSSTNENKGEELCWHRCYSKFCMFGTLPCALPAMKKYESKRNRKVDTSVIRNSKFEIRNTIIPTVAFYFFSFSSISLSSFTLYLGFQVFLYILLLIKSFRDMHEVLINTRLVDFN